MSIQVTVSDTTIASHDDNSVTLTASGERIKRTTHDTQLEADVSALRAALYELLPVHFNISSQDDEDRALRALIDELIDEL